MQSWETEEREREKETKKKNTFWVSIQSHLYLQTHWSTNTPKLSRPKCVNNDKAQRKVFRISAIISLFTHGHIGDLSKHKLHFSFINIMGNMKVSTECPNSDFSIRLSVKHSFILRRIKTKWQKPINAGRKMTALSPHLNSWPWGLVTKAYRGVSLNVVTKVTTKCYRFCLDSTALYRFWWTRGSAYTQRLLPMLCVCVRTEFSSVSTDTHAFLTFARSWFKVQYTCSYFMNSYLSMHSGLTFRLGLKNAFVLLTHP